jgi:hypothetical protein
MYKELGRDFERGDAKPGYMKISSVRRVFSAYLESTIGVLKGAPALPKTAKSASGGNPKEAAMAPGEDSRKQLSTPLLIVGDSQARRVQYNIRRSWHLSVSKPLREYSDVSLWEKETPIPTKAILVATGTIDLLEGTPLEDFCGELYRLLGGLRKMFGEKFPIFVLQPPRQLRQIHAQAPPMEAFLTAMAETCGKHAAHVISSATLKHDGLHFDWAVGSAVRREMLD